MPCFTNNWEKTKITRKPKIEVLALYDHKQSHILTFSKRHHRFMKWVVCLILKRRQLLRLNSLKRPKATTQQINKRLSVVWDNADDKHLMSRKEGYVGNVLAITTHMYLNDSGLNVGYPHITITIFIMVPAAQRKQNWIIKSVWGRGLLWFTWRYLARVWGFKL